MNLMSNVAFPEQKQDIAFSFWIEGEPQDQFLVTAFSAEEALFGLTSVSIMLLSESAEIDLHTLIDKPATLSIHHKYLEEPRYFSGIVTEAERGDEGHRKTAYRILLLPSLARLNYGSDCRIFQGMNVPDIARKILAEYGVDDVRWNLLGTYVAREYCVQYRETHLAFLERILSEEGIFFYFTYGKNGRHTLEISDHPDLLPDCPVQAELEYNAMASGVKKGVYCSSVTLSENLRANTIIQRDYTFKNPSHDLQCQADIRQSEDERQYAFYNYPGRYKQDGAGEVFTRHRLDALRVEVNLLRGSANAPHLTCGHGFTLHGHPREKINARWRLLTIRHEGTQPHALEGSGLVAQYNSGRMDGQPAPLLLENNQSEPFVLNTGKTLRANNHTNMKFPLSQANRETEATFYQCTFSAMPSHLPYRPALQHKPVIDGPQIATVTGPEGEEIYTDKHGRVKVKFPWDRYSSDDDRSSCWIRVSSGAAGGGAGHIVLPRVGDEVIVNFLEGDPDQPIITGSTYNATNDAPYGLPEAKTRSVLRSNSHKGQGFNEIAFENEAGAEAMAFHAQGDHVVIANKDSATDVNRNQVSQVGGSRSIEVGKGALSAAIVVGDLISVVTGISSIIGEYKKLGDEKNILVAASLVSVITYIVDALGNAAEATATFSNNDDLTDSRNGGSLFNIAKYLQAAAALAKFPVPGLLNSISIVQSNLAAYSKIELIGAVKISNVGDTQIENTGRYRQISTGLGFELKVGNKSTHEKIVEDPELALRGWSLSESTFSIDASGTAKFKCKKFFVETDYGNLTIDEYGININSDQRISINSNKDEVLLNSYHL